MNAIYIVVGGFILGAVFGAGLAVKRGGRKLDALQYGGAFAILFSLLGLFLAIYLVRVL